MERIMEKDRDREQKLLETLRELLNLKQRSWDARQLQNHLNPFSSTEAQLLPGEEILRSRVEELLTGNSGVLSETVTHSAASDYRDVLRKRNTASGWTATTYVDGYNWIKYGQETISGSKYPRETALTRSVARLDDGYKWEIRGRKDVLGVKYPRAYYICTEGSCPQCQATKQVQKLDTDPAIFEVTYKGRHTCNRSSHLPQPIEAESKEKPEKSKMITFERILIMANFILELPSAVFDQLSSVPKPLYAVILMLLSFAALVLCIVELVYQGRKKRLTWTRGQQKKLLIQQRL